MKGKNIVVFVILTVGAIYFFSPVSLAAKRVKIRMSLADCVELALRNNRTIRNAYLSRITQRYDLKVAEDEFVPDLFITPSFKYDSNQIGTQRSFSTEGGISFTIK